MTKKKNPSSKEHPTQIGLHSVKNLLGSERQLDLFSECESSLSKYPDINQLGFKLNDFELRVFEAILKGFTKTHYKGNTSPKKVGKHDMEIQIPLSDKFASPYKYISEIPNLVLSRREILRLAGLKENSVAHAQRTTDALKKLATTNYCCYYTRLSYDKNGVPIRDNAGNWKKEEVMAIGNLFSINFIREENSSKIQGYEIAPSPVFLDQHESYFMMIPYDWREEVQKLVGERKASSYTFRFLLFLMYEFELRRRSPREKKPYRIKWTPEKIATSIKLPESTIKRRKSRMRSMLDEVYIVAQQLGYLTHFEKHETLDILWLNEDKYFAPKGTERLYLKEEEITPKQKASQEALALYQLILEEKRKLDPKYKPATAGKIYEASLFHLDKLLKERTLKEIKAVLVWGLKRSYWCSQIGTASKLRKNFHAAFSEMMSSKGKEVNSFRVEENKRLAARLIKDSSLVFPSSVKIEILNKYLEIGDGVHQPSCIDYNAVDFCDQFNSALSKWKVTGDFSELTTV